MGSNPAPVAETPTTRVTASAATTMMPRKTPRSRVSLGNSGNPKVSYQTWVCESPSNRIEPTPSPIITTSDSRQPGSSSPLANERRRIRPSSSASANGARRPRRRNQTVKISAFARQVSRPNCAIIASVSAV
jgi:hypothetical protein